MAELTLTDWVTLFFANFGLMMLPIAVIFIVIDLTMSRRRMQTAEIIFRWVAFFALGITGIYAGFMHAFYPDVTAANIGWPNSPFQFEVAMADFALGVLGLFAFKASYGFRSATVLATTVFLWGDALGHLNQIVRYQNFTTGNAGSWFWLDIILPFILIFTLIKLPRTRSFFT